MQEIDSKKIKPYEQKDWIRENINYYKDEGSYAWIFHRISGIVLILYLFLHIWSISPLTEGKAAFEKKMAMYSGTLFTFIEWFLFAFVLFHALNGIRIILIDWAEGARYHKQLFYYTVIIGVIMFIVMGALMISYVI
ncbi:MAG: succinate dehydrogenase, cytochrome b556 subunit [Ignavibacteria bacterium]|nr:succinate dehydrogenase, cytochrome b556 subunit [Ignavibacteria bacterium]